MTIDGIVRWVHLVAAAVWTGGLITLGALVAAVRRGGADRSVLQTMARRFGHVSWTAMGLAIVTGLWQVDRLGHAWSEATLLAKTGLVGVVVALALAHQFTAKRSSPAARGAVQGLILVLSLAIFAVAVAL